MTKTQYRAALAHLELTQAGFAAFLDISTRSSNAYANGTTIPPQIAMLLDVMVANGLKPADFASIAREARAIAR